MKKQPHESGTYDRHGLLTTDAKSKDPPSISPALPAPDLDNTVLQVNDCQTQTPNGVPLLFKYSCGEILAGESFFWLRWGKLGCVDKIDKIKGVIDSFVFS